jgi:hypothetical protein
VRDRALKCVGHISTCVPALVKAYHLGIQLVVCYTRRTCILALALELIDANPGQTVHP